MVASALDFELNPDGRYQVVLTASDDGNTPPLSSTLQLWVDVEDENEPPSFPRSWYEVEVVEGIPIQTNIGLITACDPDSGVNGTLTYRLSDPLNIFEIDPTASLIYNTAEIDFESLGSARVNVTILAQDGGDLNATVSLSVFIVDRNDNPPSFLASSVNQNITITEDHNQDQPVFQFVAIDEDSGCNGAVEYSIVHADPDVFSLHSTSGLLYPSSPTSVDFEAFQTAVVVVHATDLGEVVSFSAETTLHVALTDVNDEFPVIDTVECPCFIVENIPPSSPGASCPPLSAHDLDSTDLTYEISSGNGELFQINSNTGVISITAPLDREENENYRLEIIVSDGLHVSLPMFLNIIVIDVNDNPPSFSFMAMSFTIPTDLTPGSLVGSISATDPDVGYNALTNHVIANSVDTFRLDPLSGMLYTRISLPTTTSVYSFSVSAQDQVTGNMATVSPTVTIQVMGLKNDPPSFSLMTERRTIPEDLPVGSSVAQFMASDGDGGSDGTLVYSLDEELGNHSSLFQLQPSGLLTLARSVSGLAGNLYILNVSASDSGGLRAYQLLIVTVYSSFENSFVYNPNILVCHFSGSVGESLDDSTRITELPPTQNTVSINYRILSGGASSAFQITESSDAIALESLGGFLNTFTDTESVFVTLVAEYGLNFHLCSVTVAVEDINNNPAVFSMDVTHSFQVYNITPPMSAVYQVVASDADVGTNARTVYTIDSSNMVPFEIDSITGTIRVSGMLNRPTYSIIVTAVDPDLVPPVPASRITVSVEVLGTSNYRPVFTSPTSPLVILESSRGVVADAVISDRDGDTNQQAVNCFCIASGNLRDSFNITKIGGMLMARDGLDYETLPSDFNLTIMAYDRSLNPEFGINVVSVTLVDVNEAPEFSVPVYRASVQEGEGVGVVILSVSAIDVDAGDNGIITFSLPRGQPFSIDPQNGAIRTSGNLNRENQAVIIFNVTASDRGSMSSMAEVQIALTDINNFPPVFDSINPLSVAEDIEIGDEITRLSATDRDSVNTVNALLQFAIVSGNDDRYFSLDPWTGSLRLTRTLDFEVGPNMYTLNIQVRDLGTPQHTSNLFLMVSVTDSNEHYPVFSSPVYECDISENSNSFEQICQVSATDADGTGNEVSYSLVGIGRTAFTVDSSGRITPVGNVPSHDRIFDPNYILQVQATDSHSGETKTSIAIVRVNIIDSNDVPISEPDQSLFFHESIPVNTLLFFAHVHELDTNINLSTVTYGILNSQDSTLLHLDRESGAVFLNSPLDYEAMTSPEQVTILGTNTEHLLPTSTPNRYVISILDTNENTLPPVFHPGSNPLGVWLSRASSLGSHVLSLNASDPEGDTIRYDIVGGSGQGYFEIDQNSGDISTRFSLASVEDSRLTLVIRALDGTSFPLPAWHELTITLSSEVSSKPFFARPVFLFNPSESASGVIAGIRAEADTSICYSIETGNSDQTFTIDQQTGALSLAGNADLDRDLKPLYNVTVRAEKSGMANESSLALVVVEVEDENTFRPMFLVESLDFTVFVNFPANEPLARIVAVDNDIGENGRLTYSMTSNPSDSRLAISNSSGYLHLTRPLDREDVAMYTITVTARDNDNGSPTFTDSVTLTLTVEPNFLNQPRVILNPVPALSLSENTRLGTLLTTVTLTNAASIGTTIVFRIVEHPAVISILPNTGEVFLTEPLDFETNSRLQYTIEALDGVDGRTPETTHLEIIVVDENDNRPVFQQQSYVFEVKEGHLATSIGRVVGSDRDSSNVLTYSLVDSSIADFFRVNDTNGLITVSGDVDREMLPIHTLILAVRDNGTPPLMDFTTVLVRILDADDNLPQFFPSSVEVYLPEDTPLGKMVYTVKAFDPDEGTNADVAYDLIAANSFFTLNSTTGELVLLSPLDAEVQLVHSFEVRAFKPDNTSLSSPTNLNLTVRVIDVLDTPPELIAPPTVAIRENYPPYSRVTQIQSSPSTRQIFYSIIDGDSLGHFIMEPLTGIIRTTVPLDREETASYQLLVQAAFGTGFESNITLTVTVSDSNDERPCFAAPYIRIQIPENSQAGVSLANIRIVDADEGINGTISSVVIMDSFAAEIFSIDNSGNVVLNQNQGLDREGRFSSIRFRVYAIDSGTPSQYSTAEIQIDITDENDPPRFEETDYVFVLETPLLLGTPQIRVQAEDNDIGTNGEITYSISGSSEVTEKFSIDPVTGDISVVNNYMLRDRYSLTLTATDRGGMNASANLSILVRACNFMNLTFSPSSATLSVSVLENVSNNTVVVRGSDLVVIDLNLAEGISPNVTFSLPLDNPLFRVDESGNVSVVRLDRESEQEHRLVIQTRDSSDPSRVAQAMLLVTVLDVNDNPPVFDPPNYLYSISSEDSAGTNLRPHPVSAVDPDEGSNSEITYSLLVSRHSNSFSIDQVTGIITLTSDVSRFGIITEPIELVVRATDRGDRPLHSDASVLISVIDPRAPRFTSGIYDVTIFENITTNTPVVNLTLDSSLQGMDVSFRFVSSDTPIPFSVSSGGGVVTVVDPGVDYETERNYTLRVQARNTSTNLMGFAIITVAVLDSNDNAPVFDSNSIYSQNVVENSTTGSTILRVNAADRDSGLNARVTYRLADDVPGLFSMAPSTGILILTGELDFEQQVSYQLEVLAEDDGSPSLTGSATIFVNVQNINDNPPIFREPLYVTTVRDSDEPGPTTLFVSAVDPDNLDDLSYGIVADAGPGDESFSVFTNGRIDLLIHNPSEVSYMLNVSAYDGKFFSYTAVVINVDGVNRHLPVFNQTYTATVTESAPPGIFVVQVFATDEDRGTNGRVTYRLLQQSESRFRINETTGVITTTSGAMAIDRETTPSILLQVTAMDGGSFSTSTLVDVTVADINDNPPVFSAQQYSRNLVSGAQVGTEVLTVMAFDPDAGENGTLFYSIVPSPENSQLIFIVNSQSGVVTNVVPSDFDIVQRYNFSVAVRDNGITPKTATATVVIEIVEDTSMPSFEQNTYTVPVLENATIGTTVLEPALDPNTTSVCRLTTAFTLSGGTSRFLLIGARIITIADGEDLCERSRSECTYALRVETTCVSEMLMTSIVIHTQVLVTVLEVNEPPEFSEEVYTATAVENTQTVTVTPPVMATDPDRGENATISYRLLDHLDIFEITPRSGVIIVSPDHRLDFENGVIFFILTIEAFDGGMPPKTDTAIITVSVMDMNDNPPVFNQSSYTVRVPESADLGTLVHIAEVMDIDTVTGTDSNLTSHDYSISGSVFQIGSRNGEVRVLLPLDREFQDNHTVEIIATDGFNTPALASLTVIVTDVNDEAPVFRENVYEVEDLPENYPSGRTFQRVSATDADEGINSVVVYQIAAGSNVAINSTTGEISFITPPDYEVDPQLSLTVRATDMFNEQFGTATVIIRLIDENDNPPEFSRSSYTASICENLNPGATLEISLDERVQALDRDSGQNGRVFYHIVGQGGELFSITNGDIISSVTFDREATSSVDILVVATDMGDTPMSSTASVLIHILDKNDNCPTFPEAPYTVNVQESAMVDSSIFSVTATDQDAGTNGEIVVYSISGENMEDFRLDNQNGTVVIYIRNSLDHEDDQRRVYELTLHAYDGGLEEGNATLTINIIDVNDNVPEFLEMTPYSVSVRENVTANTVLVTVEATDRDANLQQQLHYSIRNEGNHPELGINPITGEIFVATRLDYESVTSYELTVTVSDADHEASTRVSITVENVNDVIPAFHPHDASLDIQENNAFPFRLISLGVDDEDSDPNRISYNIEAGNVDDAFQISLTGDLTVEVSLDREVIEDYNLTITAQDNGVPSLTGSTILLVHVTDVNDNSPTGGHQNIYIYLLNGRAHAAHLGQVFVNDSDIVNRHTYQLLSSSGMDTVSIGDDGSIQVSSITPKVGQHSFTVTIRDEGNNPVDTTISALVRDVSDTTLSNSFSMRFSGITPERFVDGHLEDFLAATVTAVSAALLTAVEVQVFGIQASPLPGNTDVILSVQNTEDGEYIAPLHIQHILSQQRTDLESRLRLSIATLSLELCSLERCDVGTTCADSHLESLSSSSLGSGSVIFLGINNIQSYSCIPISDFRCNKMFCPEPSYCVTMENRNGEIEAECFDDCSSDPCKNGGECTRQNPGYYCQCPEGYDGRNCELTVASFTAESYIAFPALKTFGRISLEFNTERSENALLLYNGRFDDQRRDFMMVTYQGNTCCLSFSYGGNANDLCVTSRVSLGDGVWHNLVIEYNALSVSLTAVTYNHYSRAENRSRILEGSFHSLDVAAPLFLGGLPPLGLESPELPGFSGCLRNVQINGEVMDFGDPLVEFGVTEGCGCEPGVCGNEGRCFGRGECDCKPEYTGPGCTKESKTLNFLGNDFINYQIVSTQVSPLLPRFRRRRQISRYTTAENIISFSFVTREPSGTIFQLGDPQQEHVLLKVVNGHIQLEYNLGSGGHMLELGSRKVDDIRPHTVVFTRREGSLQLLLDDRFVSRATIPGSGDEVILEIPADHIYLGAQVDMRTGTVMEGFSGCLTGAKLDRRDLPFSNTPNEHFIVGEFSSDNILSGCPLEKLVESTQSSIYVYGGLGAIVGGILVISLVFVMVCGLGGACYRSRHGEHQVQQRGGSRGGSPSHGGFSWQPAYDPSSEDRKSPPNSDFTLNNLKPKPVFSSSADETDNRVAETSLAAVQQNRRGSSQTPTHSRQESQQSQHQPVLPPVEGFNIVNQANPGYLQESPASSHEESRNRFVRHIRSFSGQQSIQSTSTDATYIPKELLGMDDTEVARYIQKKLEVANVDNENYDLDRIVSFKEEGEFEPLGSIGSLHDIVKENSDTLALPVHDEVMETSQTTSKPHQSVPIPIPIPFPPTGTAEDGKSPRSPTKEHVSVSGSPSKSPQPHPQQYRKRPKPIMIRTATAPPSSSTALPPPPPPPPLGQTQPLTRANTSPVKSTPPTVPLAPPPPSLGEPQPVPMVRSPIKSPPPSVPLSPQRHPTNAPQHTEAILPSSLQPSQPSHQPQMSSKQTPKENGHWIQISKHSASQSAGSKATPQQTAAKPDSSKLRRSGRRSHRLDGKVDNSNILEKFHQVTGTRHLAIKDESEVL